MFQRAAIRSQAVANSYGRSRCIAQRKNLPPPGFYRRPPYIFAFAHVGASAEASRHHNADTLKPAGDHAVTHVHLGGCTDEWVDTGRTAVPATTRPVRGSPVVAVTEAVGDSGSHRYHRNFAFDGKGGFVAEACQPQSMKVSDLGDNGGGGITEGFGKRLARGVRVLRPCICDLSSA